VVRASRLGWVVEEGVVAVWGGVGVAGVLAAAGAGFVCAFGSQGFWLQAVKLEDSFRIVVFGLHSVTAIFCCWAVSPVDGQCQRNGHGMTIGGPKIGAKNESSYLVSKTKIVK
jgi:hypothetical protein